MVDIEKKIEKIEKNCYEIARKELINLKQENDNISDKEILDRVNNYKDELSEKYENELKKIDRQYNRYLYDYEMNERVKINKFKETLISNINYKIETEFQKFIDSDEYEGYLFRNINNTLKNINNVDDCIIYITENDYYKFKDKIIEKFKINLDKISNENIGGCVLIDNKSKISIDNTIKTNIDEKIKEIKF